MKMTVFSRSALRHVSIDVADFGILPIAAMGNGAEMLRSRQDHLKLPFLLGLPILKEVSGQPAAGEKRIHLIGLFQNQIW